VGDIELKVKRGAKAQVVTIKDVLYIPGGMNLLSIGTLTQRGYETVFTDERCEIRRAGTTTVVATGTRYRKLYMLDMYEEEEKMESCATAVSGAEQTLELWHQRLGHANYRSVRMLLETGCEEPVKLPPADKKAMCEGCIEGKSTEDSFPGATRRATQPLELVHADVWGPSRLATTRGSKYFLLLTDDFSRFRWLYY
jgi:hypothetical protein